MEIAIVDAFTRTPGDGNRAGVVLDARGLSDAAMQSAAHAVGASETAFLLPGPRLRYFTPTSEVPFCGHATVASFHLLGERGRHQFECGAGRLAVEVDDRVWLEPPVDSFEDLEASWLWPILGSDGGAAVRCGSFLLLPTETRRQLFALAPRWDDLAEALRARALTGVCIFTRDVIEPGNLVHSRFFAPGAGIREDPATGSVHGPLAAHLAKNGVLQGRAEQGDAMGKPSRLELQVSGGRVRVGGEAVTVMKGRLVV